MTTMLLFTAALLGLLAFFEPCTIATHTLYSVKTYREGQEKVCCQTIIFVWLSRTLLLITLFMLSVLLVSPPDWGEFVPSIILSVMAAIYLVTRFVYLPIPNLEFYKFIPGAKQLPHSIHLGLTFPACTLPLVVIVAGMSVMAGSVAFAALAGILFSSFFTAPMAIILRRGLNVYGLDVLNRAAKGSPYLTAVLLFSLALYLLVPERGINIAELKVTLSEASWAGVSLAFMVGFVFSFNPVSFASIPVMLAYVTKAQEERRAVLMGTAFVTGMIVTHVVLGVAAALGGEWVKGLLGRQWGLVLGPLLFVMGLIWSGLLNIRLPWFGVKGRRVTGLWGAFLLGIPFSVAVCPFCTPALLVTLTASAAIGSVAFGFALLFAFALGRSVPVLLGAWSMGWLESLNIMSRYQKHLEVVAGLTLMLTGFYLLNEYFFLIEY